MDGERLVWLDYLTYPDGYDLHLHAKQKSRWPKIHSRAHADAQKKWDAEHPGVLHSTIIKFEDTTREGHKLMRVKFEPIEIAA